MMENRAKIDELLNQIEDESQLVYLRRFIELYVDYYVKPDAE